MIRSDHFFPNVVFTWQVRSGANAYHRWVALLGVSCGWWRGREHGWTHGARPATNRAYFSGFPWPWGYHQSSSIFYYFFVIFVFPSNPSSYWVLYPHLWKPPYLNFSGGKVMVNYPISYPIGPTQILGQPLDNQSFQAWGGRAFAISNRTFVIEGF